MKRLTILTSLVFALSLGTAFVGGEHYAVAPATAQQTSASPARHDVRQAVETFVNKYLDAYNRKDAAGVAALYTEDGFLVPPGPIVTGKPNIEKAWQAAFDSGRTGLRYDTREIQADGNLVWSVGQFTVMTPDESGKLQERWGNFANIYQWVGNELRFRVHAFNFAPGPRPR